MQEPRVPGTVMPYSETGGMFAMFRPLIQATDGLTLGQVCAITGLEPSTVQNWVKRGFVAHPVRKKYHERQLARILLISALRESMQIDRIGELMGLVNGSADDTGDDIVSEEQLYDYLCEAIGQTDALTLKNIPQTVQTVTADYTGPTPESAQRLRLALCAMVSAYTAAQYKQAAEQWMEQMKEEQP